MLTLKDLAATVVLTAVTVVASLAAALADSDSDHHEIARTDICATEIGEVDDERTCSAPPWRFSRR